MPQVTGKATKRKLTKHPDELGQGAIEGVARPEPPTSVILGQLMEVQARRALVGSGEDLGVFVGRPLTVILPNLPALAGWRRERADAAAED